MAMRKATTARPTLADAGILKRIAGSMLVKTRLPDRTQPVWQIDGGDEIPHDIAVRLIRNGWLTPQRDGLGILEESQTYRALTPTSRP